MNPFRNDRMFQFLLVLTAAATVGLQVWRTLFDNFAVQMAGLDGHHMGIIQSVREIPGFLALLAVYVLLFIREHRLAALSVAVLGMGVAVTGFFPGFTGLVCTTLVMSFGFHYFETTNQSLTLQYFDQKTAPVVFGRLRSVAAASNVCVGILLFFAAPLFSFEVLFLFAGLMIFGVGIWAFTQDPTRENLAVQHRKMILRKRYWLFYLMTFLAGARRQIFIAFAVFLLVQRFAFSVQEVALLFLFNNVVNYFLSPWIGKAIVRFGERRVLSLEYSSLILIFVAYGFADSKLLVAVLYILDHVFFNFAIAIRTYFQKVADPQDIAPSMAVGFTINHIAAVVLPVLGGLLWMVDYRIPFFAGAVLSLVSLIAVQWIRIPSQTKF